MAEPIPSAPVERPPPPAQRWSFLSPSVDFTPAGEWETSNLAAYSPGPANVSISAQGTGFNFSARHNDISQLKLYVNGTDAESFGGKVNLAGTERNGVVAEVTGLEHGWWDFTLASAGNLTFNSARAVGGARVSEANATQLDKAQGVRKEGDWDESYTNSTGACLIIKPPLGTGLLELAADQPPVPFGAFRATIDPPPAIGPAAQEFHPNLLPAPIQAMIAQGNVPIFSTVLHPVRRHKIYIEYIGDGEPFVAARVTYFP